MKCQVCNINDAQIVFTQIVDNEKLVMRICIDCAREKGLSIEFESADIPEKSPKTAYDEFFEGKLNEDTPVHDLPDITCLSCGLTFRAFKSDGLFGCDSCHEAFGGHVKEILKQIHGYTEHKSFMKKRKSPRAKAREDMKDLKSSLERYVANEEYEKAAEIRDKIAEIQKGMEEK